MIVQTRGLALALVVVIGTVAAFSVSSPAALPFAALVGGSLVLLLLPALAHTTPRSLFERVDWSVLILPLGLFIVMEEVETPSTLTVLRAVPRGGLSPERRSVLTLASSSSLRSAGLAVPEVNIAGRFLEHVTVKAQVLARPILSVETTAILETYGKEYRPVKYVFEKAPRVPFHRQWLNEILERACNETGVPTIVPRDFRRTLATLWDGPDRELEIQVGWKPKGVIHTHYKKGNDPARREVIDRLFPPPFTVETVVSTVSDLHKTQAPPT